MNDQKKPVARMPRKRVAAWGVLFLFISGWMFVLGILVGRGTAPVALDANHLQQELAELKAALTDRRQAEIEAQASGQSSQAPELGFYEALKKPAAEKHFKMPPLPPDPAPKPNPAIKPNPAPKPGPDIKEPEPKTEPSTASKPALVDEKPDAPHDGGRFTIQVAALKDAAGAEALVDRLRKKGYPAYQIKTTTQGGGVWYRVRVGAFNDRAAAVRTLGGLNTDKIKGLIVDTR